jgi:anti-sigma factor RsiW
MTNCAHIQPRLTAYLDGELADADGSVVRGHLRECAACREIARAEAVLRDGLRDLAPVDPPATLWAGVQARLAAAEVADAHQPWWRRMARRWTPALPSMAVLRQLAAGTALAAAAVVALAIRAHHAAPEPGEAPPLAIAAPEPTAPAVAAKDPEPAADVTADLAADASRTTARYGEVVEELMKLATEARPGWSAERKAAFDAELAGLRATYDRAEPGRPQQRVQRQLIRLLQGAVIRDDVMLASGGVR